jgi:hypothetical protein
LSCLINLKKTFPFGRGFVRNRYATLTSESIRYINISLINN